MSHLVWKFWLVAIALLMSGGGLLQPVDGALPQVKDEAPPPDDSATDQKRLPPHALWRIENQKNNRMANGIYRLKFSSDGKLLATRNRRNGVAIYDVATHKKRCEVDGHPNNWVETIDFSPDGKLFVTTAGEGEKVKVWDSQTGKLIVAIATRGDAAFFTPDGDRLIIFGEMNVETWAYRKGKLISKKKWKSNNSLVHRLAMSPNGKRIAMYMSTNPQTHHIRVLFRDRHIVRPLPGPVMRPKQAFFSPDGDWLAATYHRGTDIMLWNVRDPERAKFILRGHKKPVHSVAFSPDNRFLVSAGWDHKVILWDLLSRQKIIVLDGHTEHVNAIAVAPLDFKIASGASGRTDTSVIIWDFKSSLFSHWKQDTEETFESVWNEMGFSSVEQSWEATTQLIKFPERYLPLLEEEIQKSAKDEVDDRFQVLIRQLDSPQFSKREEAMKELYRLMPGIRTKLEAILDSHPSAEIRYRIKKIFSNKRHYGPKINFNVERRWHRAVFALEMLNSPQADRCLKQIAKHHAVPGISQDAQAALLRNEMRRHATHQ